MVIPAGLRPFALAPQRSASAPAPESAGPVDEVKLSSKPRRGFWKKTALVACLALAGGLGCAQAQQAAHPDPAPISLAQQLENGRVCEWQITRSHGKGDDPVQLTRIQKLQGTLLQHAERGGIPYKVTLTKGHGNWAGSCDNGALFIDQALASQLSDGELLFVAGHELGHTELGHQTERKAFQDSLGWRWLLPWNNYSARLNEMGNKQELAADCFSSRLVGKEGHPGLETGSSALAKVLRGEEEQGGDHPGLQTRVDNLKACTR